MTSISRDTYLLEVEVRIVCRARRSQRLSPDRSGEWKAKKERENEEREIGRGGGRETVGGGQEVRGVTGEKQKGEKKEEKGRAYALCVFSVLRASIFTRVCTIGRNIAAVAFPRKVR